MAFARLILQVKGVENVFQKDDEHPDVSACAFASFFVIFALVGDIIRACTAF